MPDQTSITLAPSLVVTIDIAPGIDTTGIDIDGAKKAYYGFVKTADEAVHDPSKQWQAEFEKYSVEPVLSGVLEEIAAMAKSGTRSVGHSQFTAVATKATRDQVTLRVCVDISGIDTVSADGSYSVKASTGDLHPQDATVARSSSGTWHVTTIVGFPREPC